MSVQKTCAKVKSFLNRLNEKVGEGSWSLFGRHKEVDAAQVFDAFKESEQEDAKYKSFLEKAASPNWGPLTSDARSMRNDMPIESRRKERRVSEKGTKKTVTYLTYNMDGSLSFIDFESASDGVRALAYKGAKKSAQGEMETAVSELINSNGEATLNSKGGRAPGTGILELSRTRSGHLYSGVLMEQEKHFNGKMERLDGSAFQGKMAFSAIGTQRLDGTEYDPDGRKLEEGQYRNDVLAEGHRYSPDGKILATLTTLSDERRATQAKIEREQAETKRLAIERQNRESKTKQENEARIARMNPGELYAYADELSSGGKPEDAKKIYRMLLSKYPNHALAANAAQALSSGGNFSRSEASNTNAGEPKGNVPRGDCEQLIETQENEFLAINKRQLTGMTEGLERVMWMTSQRILIIDQNCPNNKKYTQMRADLKTAFDQAKQNCAQISSDPCKSQPH